MPAISQAFAPARGTVSPAALQRARAANAAQAAVPTSIVGSPASVEALVRREFPPLLGDATPPSGVWIVQDASGRTLRTGTLASGETLGSVWARLQRELPDRRLRPFEMVNLRGAQGAPVLVGISRAE